MRVIVVTGAGRGLCAGADARALEKHAELGGYDDGVRVYVEKRPPDFADPT